MESQEFLALAYGVGRWCAWVCAATPPRPPTLPLPQAVSFCESCGMRLESRETVYSPPSKTCSSPDDNDDELDIKSDLSRPVEFDVPFVGYVADDASKVS